MFSNKILRVCRSWTQIWLDFWLIIFRKYSNMLFSRKKLKSVTNKRHSYVLSLAYQFISMINNKGMQSNYLTLWNFACSLAAQVIVAPNYYFEGTGWNPVEAWIFPGFFFRNELNSCPPTRIISLLDFCPQFKLNFEVICLPHFIEKFIY